MTARGTRQSGRLPSRRRWSARRAVPGRPTVRSTSCTSTNRRPKRSWRPRRGTPAPTATASPPSWARPLHGKGIRTSLWINPYVEQGTSLTDDLVSRGFLLLGPDGRPAATSDTPDTILVDFLNVRAGSGANGWPPELYGRWA
jgi:hypothetical protein